ncbi:hypothetical protein [Nocardia pseudovaccinii]|uniref:hypothetical protein n=1 Tax=Nocardia pseudovaccinii TaxID=189540 RepID=UPI0007A42A5E|nr:hypothetical protein [Nocardia pseudovaccinii]
MRDPVIASDEQSPPARTGPVDTDGAGTDTADDTVRADDHPRGDTIPNHTPMAISAVDRPEIPAARRSNVVGR